MSSPYAVTDRARFSFDARKVFPGTFGARDPMRYVADAFRHCERTEYGVAEFVAGARLAWGDSAGAAYWDAVERAVAFFEAHPNARQVVHAFRRNAPRCYTERMMARASHVDALDMAASLRQSRHFSKARACLAQARHYRLAA